MSIYIPDDFKHKVKLALKDFSSDFTENNFKPIRDTISVRIERKVIPVPELILFIFSNILDFPNLGRMEKMRWYIRFKYKSIICSIAYQKSGIYLYYEKPDSNDLEVNPDEIIGKIAKSFRIIEENILQDFSKYQIKEGNITIPNIYYMLDRMYQYFREKAEKFFNTRAKDEYKFGDIKTIHNGFYDTIAMIDSFFSKTEHVFILILPFAGFNSQNDDLLKLIGASWQNKYKRIFQIDTDVQAKKYYDKLINVKENLRNTFIHGGFEKSGASLLFHLPEVGNIPVNLTKVKDSPHFNFFPVEGEDFNKICKLFDEFELWIKSGKLAQGIRYIESGLNVPFDNKSLSIFNKAMATNNEFEKLIEKWSYLSDQHENMDY